ncbi:unnamed protein product, partial [Musa acuminata subsp. burmannicoides]
FLKKNVIVKSFCNVEVRSVFCAPSQKFKILTIPNKFAFEKSYMLGFVKKRGGHKFCTKSRFDCFTEKLDGHKDCTKSRFNWFIMHRLKILLTIPNILAQENLGIMLAIPNILSHENLYKPSRYP